MIGVPEPVEGPFYKDYPMKKTLLTLIILTITTTLFALPGFTSFVPDTAGEYVWYRDNSFARESYVGLLNYDDTSYQIRYYAPASRTIGQPAKDIALLFTVNPESDFFDLFLSKDLSSPLSESFLSNLLPAPWPLLSASRLLMRSPLLL